MCYLSGLEYKPNIDGVLYFSSTVFPLMRRISTEDLRLTIVGRSPRSRVLALARQPGIEVIDSPPDVGHYAEADIAIVPIRSGGGTQIKILEAFSYGVPVVSTTIGAEGIDAEPGREILIADDAEDMAEQCVALIEEPDRREAIAAAAEALFERRYSAELLPRVLAQVYPELISVKSIGRASACVIIGDALAYRAPQCFCGFGLIEELIICGAIRIRPTRPATPARRPGLRWIMDDPGVLDPAVVEISPSPSLSQRGQDGRPWVLGAVIAHWHRYDRRPSARKLLRGACVEMHRNCCRIVGYKLGSTHRRTMNPPHGRALVRGRNGWRSRPNSGACKNRHLPSRGKTARPTDQYGARHLLKEPGSSPRRNRQSDAPVNRRPHRAHEHCEEAMAHRNVRLHTKPLVYRREGFGGARTGAAWRCRASRSFAIKSDRNDVSVFMSIIGTSSARTSRRP